MLGLRIVFLNGVFHAADPFDPRQPEWPPAPDRLFQALVAAAYANELDPAPLRSLEGVAPTLVFGTASMSRACIGYVPSAYPPIAKKVEKRDPTMVDIIDPVFMMWPDVPDTLASTIGAIAARVDYLGRAKSPVAIERLDAAPPSLPFHFVPTARGSLEVRVPPAGRLDELDAAHAAGGRAAVIDTTSYEERRTTLPISPWGELVVRPVEALEIHRTAQLTDSLRRAVLGVAGDEAPSALHGHGVEAPEGHAAWVALPDVAHHHARGNLLGCGLWLPTKIDEHVRACAVIALRGVSRFAVGERVIAFRTPPARAPVPRALKPRTWTARAHEWVTVTPFVFDRHPRRGTAPESAVADSVELAGYPRPREIALEQGGAWHGVPPARRFRPRGPGRWSHVRLVFDEPQAGPVLIGRERHFGLGLCRPVRPRPEADGPGRFGR